MKKRVIYADVLRVAAIFLVIVIHTVSLDLGSYPVASYQWQTLNIYNGFSRISVPLFFMVSGIFFLDPQKEVPINKLYQKNIFRIVLAFIFWSALYALIFTVYEYRTINSHVVKVMYQAFIEGHFHLWFLFRLIEVYVMVPFLRKIAEDKRLIEYFLLFCFVVGFLNPTYHAFPLKSTTTIVERGLKLDITFGYLGYFFAGYYLSRYSLSKIAKLFLYSLGIAGVIGTIVVANVHSLKAGKPYSLSYEYLTPNVLFASAAAFLFVKESLQQHEFSGKTSKWMIELSRYSFGIYLIHVLIRFIFTKLGLTTFIFTPILSVPLLAVLLFFVSYICVKLLAKIPFLKRFIL